MKFKLLKDILEFKAGTIISISYKAAGDGFAHLGWQDYGWEIPLFIIERNPEWFERVKE